MSDNIKEVLLIGPGYMGKEYAKVLKGMGISPIVIGRGEENARRFEEECDLPVITGDIRQNILELSQIPDFAIVAASAETLVEITMLLLNNNVKHILVEKPAGIYRSEVEQIAALAEEKHANVYVAYNRRYYASTQKALEIIKEDGGVTSFSFEFTEWGDRIKPSVEKRTVEYKEAWFMLNSTHVVDLAFFLGGLPIEMQTFAAGELDWHKTGCVYAGAGITEKGALFSYQANWDAPGRWGVEILTSKHRLYFKPMEELQIQEKNSVAVCRVELDDEIDKLYKPGLYRQVESFLYEINDGCKKTISEHLAHMKFYELIEKKQQR